MLMTNQRAQKKMENELRLSNDKVKGNKCQSMKKYKMYILVYKIIV